MKKPKNKTILSEDLPATVSAAFDNFQLLESLVEKLAFRRPENSFYRKTLHSDWEIIEGSSVEAYVNGNFYFSENEEYVCMPFTSCFFFTCTRGQEGVDNLSWSNSLS